MGCTLGLADCGIWQVPINPNGRGTYFVQMDEDKLWANLCADHYIKLQRRCVGAHPWILERRNALARGMYN